MRLVTLNPLFSPKSQTARWGQVPREHGKGMQADRVGGAGKGPQGAV